MITVDQIVDATGCKRQRVEANWPFVLRALEDIGIGDDMTQIAAVATIAVETGVFAPIIEKRASQEKQPAIWSLQNRYWDSGFMGRGYVQLTWKENYDKYGKAIGVDLVNNPDMALEPETAAKILAYYFKEKKVNESANAKDWRRTRVRVNGGLIGYDKFAAIVKLLGGM